jgi:D-alanine-D-alanine ligase
MAVQDLHIEIVGSSGTGLSSMGHASREAARRVLQRHFTRVGITVVDSTSDLEHMVSTKPDLVFLGAKQRSDHTRSLYPGSNAWWIGDYLDRHGIAYTGSNSAAHQLEMHKHLAKQVVADAGLATTRWVLVKVDQVFVAQDVTLPFPLFVKPASLGGGQGVASDSLVYDLAQLEAKVATLRSSLQADVLIEEYLPGREFSISIIKDAVTGAYDVIPLELIALPDIHGQRILSAAVKSSNTETVVAVAPGELRRAVCKLGFDVFHVLGARDYGRIDIRLDANVQPHFLEANLMPSLISGYGTFPKACLIGLGMEYPAMMRQIVHLGLSRRQLHRQYPVSGDSPQPVTPTWLASVPGH